MSDRFGTAGIRRRVLDSWTASPARFREDANAEEDLVLGGYRDRLIVELAQNAADAAAAAGRAGRLLLSVREAGDDGPAVLVAANTGAPLDADGVQALATLRASAKRDGATVGRFGVGFAAVLAVSDEPAVISRSGGVRFSAAESRQLVLDAGAIAPDLGAELERRDGRGPVLRLPFPADGIPPDGYDTAVILPLRDRAATDLVLGLLAEVADPLLLALPDLAEIVLERPGRAPVVLRDPQDRWHLLRRTGTLPAGLLAGRPIEERGRDRWAVTWALPREDGDTGLTSDDGRGPAALVAPGVVHAPTPSDEPLPWPALLVATLPLDPSRRHVAESPVTDAVVTEAARAYADLVTERAAAGAAAWRLVVTGLPSGHLDAALRHAVAGLLPDRPLLPSAGDRSHRLRPREATALAGPVGADRAAVAALAARLPGLVLAPRASGPVFALLGVRRIDLADAVEQLSPVADPQGWQDLYAALAPLAVDATAREALALLPVPLADGSVVRGVRGLLLAPPREAGRPELGPALAVLGARVVHPVAVHPLLERLGATPASPRALLDLPVVRAAVEGGAGDGFADLAGPSSGDLTDAVLTLVTAALSPGGRDPVAELPWLAELTLVDSNGEPARAGELVLPGSPASQWYGEGEFGEVAQDLVGRWGATTLQAVGVLRGLALLRLPDVPLDDDDAPDLDGWDEWLDSVADRIGGLPSGAVLGELVAVRDLDLVRPGALPAVVTAIAADPALRPALVSPARIVADGASLDAPSYTAWWLRTELFRGQAGDAPTGSGAMADPAADRLVAALLPPAPDWIQHLDPGVRRALGVLRSVADLDAGSVPAVLDRLTDEHLHLPAELLTPLVARLAGLAGAGLEIDRPERVRVVDGAGSAVVPAGTAVVIEAPMYRQRPDLGHPLPAPSSGAAALADLLDLPLAGELAAGLVDEGAEAGETQPVPAQLRQLLPGAPAQWCEHDRLLVDGYEVDWWVAGEGPGVQVHAATTDGLARALAWAAGLWDLRALAAGLLSELEVAADVLVDQVWSRPG